MLVCLVAAYCLTGYSVEGATLPFARPWPLARVPLLVSNRDAAPDVGEAVAEIERRTPVRFVKYAGQDDYVEVVLGGGDVVHNSQWHHNTSDVIGFCPGRSVVHLQPGKGWLAMHELGHVLGLVHEHQRADRDQFVEVLWSHMHDPEPGLVDWVRLTSADAQGLSYDPNSVMHYGQDWQSTGGGALTLRWRGAAGAAADCIHCKAGWSHLSKNDAAALTQLYAKEAALRVASRHASSDERVAELLV